MGTAAASPLQSPEIAPPAALLSRSADDETVRYRLSKDCTASVVFSGAITQSAIDKLRAHLDLSKDTYPEHDEG